MGLEGLIDQNDRKGHKGEKQKSYGKGPQKSYKR